MRNRRRTRLLKRLVLGFAVALVAVPVAQAYPDEGGAQAKGTFIPGVSDFPNSSFIAADQSGLVVQGESKDGLGVASPTAAVISTDIWRVQALSRSGRFRVMTATSSWVS